MDEGWVIGHHAVLAALEGERGVEVVWVQQGRRDQRVHRVVVAARAAGVPVRQVPRERLDRVAAGVPHNGCGARVAPLAFASLEGLIRPAGEPGRLLVLDDLTDPHNVGAVLRSAAAFAVDGVVLAGPSAPPLGGALAKAAAGALERVPLARATVAGDVLARLQREGYWVLGADAAGSPLDAFAPGPRWALCVGSEERGLRAKTRTAVDELVAIPMAPGTQSLNVSVATGILLYALAGAVR